jgi:hypothetical protein
MIQAIATPMMTSIARPEWNAGLEKNAVSPYSRVNCRYERDDDCTDADLASGRVARSSAQSHAEPKADGRRAEQE